MPLRFLHRASAVVLIAFAVAHIGNHVGALLGVAAHIEIMRVLRLVYRQPVVEALLLLCAGFQVASGLWMLVRGWAARSGRVAWTQALSGAYLAFFLLVHVPAVLAGRHVFQLDTNFYFAAAGFHVAPFGWFFAPYYTLAVFALFTHLGCAFFWRFHEHAPRQARMGLGLAMAIGAAVSLCICLLLAGWLVPVDIPAPYKATYGA